LGHHLLGTEGKEKSRSKVKKRSGKMGRHIMQRPKGGGGGGKDMGNFWGGERRFPYGREKERRGFGFIGLI